MYEINGRPATREQLFAHLTEVSRERNDYQRPAKSLWLSAVGVLRRLYGGHDDDAKQRAAAKKRAMAEAKRLERWLKTKKGDPPAGSKTSALGLMMARSIAVELQVAREKAMAAAVEQLPVWSWAQDVKGVAELSLATILGETGDLDLYPHWRPLWKRMGVAVIDGSRQRIWASGKDELNALHGHSKRRRQALWSSLHSAVIQHKTSYRDVYDERREKMDAEHPEYPKLQRYLDAHRLAEKAFLADLWRAWRDCERAALGEDLAVAA